MGGEYQSSNSSMFPGGIQKGLAIKVDSCGCLEEGCNPLCNVSIGQQFITAQNTVIYPNPATDFVNIELNRITSYNVCYTKLLRSLSFAGLLSSLFSTEFIHRQPSASNTWTFTVFAKVFNS